MNVKVILFIVNIFFIAILSLLFLSIISLSIIDWPYPDESNQFSMVKDHGLLKAIAINYFYLSVGRPASTAWIDLWMWFLQFFNLNSLVGFMFYRFATFFFMLFSVFYLIKFFFKNISTTTAIIFALLFFNISLISLGSYQILQVYGLDLALYGVSLCYSIFFVIFTYKILENIEHSRLKIFFYYFFLLLYLNSSYAHLVTGGLILYFGLFTKQEVNNHFFNPLKSINHIFFKDFKNKIFFLFKPKIIITRESIFLFGLILYIISALVNLLSPSLYIRNEIWPKDHSLILGFYNSIPVLEGFILFEWGWYYLFIMFIGIFLSMKMSNNISKYSVYLRIVIILITPLTVLLTNSLAFTSSSLQSGLWLGWPGPDWSKNYFTFFSFISEYFEYKYATSARHIFYFNNIAIITYFFLGIEIGNYARKKLNIFS